MGNTETKTTQYTQVTSKELNNIIFNKKTISDLEKNKIATENYELFKKYLFKIDIGKQLLDAANKQQTSINLIQECGNLVTSDYLEKCLVEYTNFVNNTLKIDVKIEIDERYMFDRDLNEDRYNRLVKYYKVTW
jgi:arginyl-tRNA--protein-N-Asp/Glu arginylyltransferase